MSKAPIPTLMLTLALGVAVLAQQAAATPRQGIDGQGVKALEAPVHPNRIVALAVRRVAIADPDLDGVVSAAEAQRYYERRFVLMDRNRDGRLSEPEFFRIAMRRSLQALDEPSDARPLTFEAVDVDGSGTVTPEEFLRADVMRRSWRIGASSEADRRSLFDALDGDADAAVAKREFIDAGMKQFSASDADGDGRVTIWEFYRGTHL